MRSAWFGIEFANSTGTVHHSKDIFACHRIVSRSCYPTSGLPLRQMKGWPASKEAPFSPRYDCIALSDGSPVYLTQTSTCLPTFPSLLSIRFVGTPYLLCMTVTICNSISHKQEKSAAKRPLHRFVAARQLSTVSEPSMDIYFKQKCLPNLLSGT
jgi:hypothetical protein